jgi:multiple sugar transport system substrate-binding protein
MPGSTHMAEVRFLGCDNDVFCASVQARAAEFEQASGHKLTVRLLDNDFYYANKLTDYLGGASPADVYMSGPVLAWEQLGLGFVRSLDEFIGRASASLDLADFFERLIRASRWGGHFGEALGTGPLLMIPVNWESYNLAYMPELLARAGVDVPQTWEEYFAAARTVTERVPGARGFGQRGADAWHTVYTGFATQLWSCGGRDFDPDGSCAIASDAAVEVARTLSEAIRVAGPPDWTSQAWYELAIDFANGKYGLLVDSDHYVAYFENPRMSNVAGQVRYAVPPAGPGGVRRPNMWMWSMVMNARSEVPDAAWEFMAWAASSEFLTQAALQGNMNPTRRSTWTNPEFGARARQWHEFPDVAMALVGELGEVLVTPALNYIEVARRWTRALRQAYRGEGTLEQCLATAAIEIDELVDRG